MGIASLHPSYKDVQGGWRRFVPIPTALIALVRNSILCSRGGELPAQQGGGRELLLHGQCRRPSILSASRQDRTNSIRFSRGIATSSIFARRDRRATRTFTLHMDAARRGCGFCHAMALDQIGIFKTHRSRRRAFTEPGGERRARDLAAALLGAHAARRARF